eukprot:TRINITY_DN64692_c0_g1_i1.p1 TRINITY_DN64692_c0_g1~~TRINITY_DN64692_c0_g1_i1.p1  ORF type:complete len:768 (+),score=184.59 TRINITY_DN64692_c0_g1_i1:60-2306(+)
MARRQSRWCVFSACPAAAIGRAAAAWAVATAAVSASDAEEDESLAASQLEEDLDLADALGADDGAAAADDGAASLPAWPELCEPLLRRSGGEDYPWARRCGRYSYGDRAMPQGDALLCGLTDWGGWHRSMVCELFRIAVDCTDLPCTSLVADATSLSSGLRRGSAALPRGAGNYVEVLLVHAAPALVEVLPRGEIGFPAFVALYMITALCLRAQPEGVQRIYHLRSEPLGREGCKDLVTEHFEHVLEAAAKAAQPATAAAEKRQPAGAAVARHVSALLPVGPLGVADAEPSATEHYALLPGDAAWSRFVVRAPRAAAASGGRKRASAAWLEAQEAWGWQNAWAAAKLAAKLDDLPALGDTAEEQVDAWLQALGAARAAMLDGRDNVEGEQRQVGYRRWRDTQRTLTPISGPYRPMWRAALLRRVGERGAMAQSLFELPGNAAAAEAGTSGGRGSLKRGWRCGAVLSWVEVPDSCNEVVESAGVDEAAAQDMSAEEVSPFTSLVPTASNGCAVLLNRAVLRSAIDAAVLELQDCHSWYGVPVVQHNASYAARPQWIHADLTALTVLERLVLPRALEATVAAVRSVWEDEDASTLEVRLRRAAEAIAAFTFYLFVGAPYTRGSASVAILSHHALYMWLLGGFHARDRDRGELARHRLQAIRCLPNWRAHAMPDVEAASSQTVERYVQDGYWASFEGAAELGAEQVRAAVVSCLAEVVNEPPSAAAEARGREDARRLKEVLATLNAGSALD